MKTVLVTGVTGIIGRPFVAELLRRGYAVIALCRSIAPSKKFPNGVSVKERLCHRGFKNDIRSGKLVCVDGDFTREFCGMEEDKFVEIRKRAPMACFHLGGNTNFSELPTNREVWTANVVGMENILKLCNSVGISMLHVGSSFVVCGDGNLQEKFYENDLWVEQTHRNIYERSTYHKERLAGYFYGRGGVWIHRLPITVGLTEEEANGDGVPPGFIDDFSGYYGYFYMFSKTYEKIRRIFTEETSSNLDKRTDLECAGVYYDSGTDRVYLPIVVPARRTPLIMASVGWVVRTMADLFDLSIDSPPYASRGVFHVVNPPENAPHVVDVITHSLDALRIDGVKIMSDERVYAPLPPSLTGLAGVYESEIGKALEMFRPYTIEYMPRIVSDETMRVLAQGGRACAMPPPHDAKRFHELMDFAQIHKFRPLYP